MRRPDATKKPTRSPDHSGSAAVSLPVVNGGGAGPDDPRRIRPSRNAPKRAIVLAIVQILIIMHIIQWVVTGKTTTPIEPSEAMEFSRQGIINMGLIFFALTLLSTLIFGRWFCGWACHVVLLQDLCHWMMKKVGIRPKPFRSRLLMYVPLIIALYIFIWPAFHRLAIAPWLDQPMPPWQVQVHLTTTEFWQTFPGVWVAIPFLFICGFMVVYFLGAKGFCTYGCPYGGFYAPFDEYAPGRIRVTDDCRQSGHCTAVCSSNVRVNEEVREYGMVVDPGCMKCLDCVSVCPNNALYYGFGKPAFRKGPPKRKAPKARYDLTWKEEFAFAGVFAGSFFIYRGLYGIIPLLMAVGMAIVTTYLMWKLWRLWRDDNVSLHRYRLRYKRGLTRAGMTFAGMVAIVIGLTVHSGVVRAAHAAGGWFDDRVNIPREIVYFGDREAAVDDQTRRATERGLAMYTLASSLGEGGIGFSAAWQPMLNLRRAWLHSVLGDFDEAVSLLERAVEMPSAEASRFRENALDGLALVMRAQGRNDEALGLYREELLERGEYHNLLESFVLWAVDAGRAAEAIEVCEARLEQWPDDGPTIRWLALLRMDQQRRGEAITLLERAIDVNDADVAARRLLAIVHSHAGEWDAAERHLRKGLEHAPNHPTLHQLLAQVLQSTGRAEEARRHQQKAEELAERLMPPAGPDGSPLTD